ncbi:hypothetical protein AU476_01215 [Cupriavidus sp. UYMSc13B]|nr:hypothetical protein AU476_01215 [Cupriavidus sp. UYMSc13B]
MLFDLQTFPSEAIKLRKKDTGTYAIPTLSRSRLYAWQRQVNEMVWDMVDNTEMPNLEFGKW